MTGAGGRDERKKKETFNYCNGRTVRAKVDRKKVCGGGGLPRSSRPRAQRCAVI